MSVTVHTSLTPATKKTAQTAAMNFDNSILRALHASHIIMTRRCIDMTLFQEIREWAQKMKQYQQQFCRDYDASHHRVDATRKDIDKWTTPRAKVPTKPKT